MLLNLAVLIEYKHHIDRHRQHRKYATKCAGLCNEATTDTEQQNE